MKNLSILLIAGLAALLTTACAPIVYESPQAGYPVIIRDHSPVVVTHHPSRHEVNAHARHHARIERELARRHKQVAHIYGGYGQPDELVEINLQGGYLWHQGRKVHYSPISFMIAIGDIIRLPSGIVDVDLFVRYQNGRIALDTDIFGHFGNTVAHLTFESDWHRERHYRVDNRHLKGAKIIVKAVPPKHYKRDHRDKRWKGKETPQHRYDDNRDIVTDKRQTPWPDHRSKKVVVYKKEKNDRLKHDKVSSNKIVERKTVTQYEDGKHKQRQVQKRVKKEERYQVRKDSRQDKDFARESQPEKVKVVFDGGTVQRNGRHDSLKKTAITLKQGETKQVKLKFRDGKDVKVPVTYRDGRVIVDHSGKEFKVSDRQKDSRQYQLSTKGRNRLENVQVQISSL